MIDISEEPEGSEEHNNNNKKTEQTQPQSDAKPSSDAGIPSKGIKIWDETTLVSAVIAKHRRLLDAYRGEFGVLDPKVSELLGQSGEERDERNKINEHVAELKDKRQLLYHQAKQLRIEMFDLINARQSARKHEQEMTRLQKDIETLDWKLQTTVMGIKKEREIVEKIKKLSKRIDEINEIRSGDGTDTVDETIKFMSSNIAMMIEEADKCHNEIVSIADQSQEHHESFVGYVEQLKEVRGRHIWLKTRIDSHVAAVDYWEDKQKAMAAEGAGDDHDG
ncbi:MAG TPA: hypothetical protein EYP67_07455 [Methanosarcinales archaeon]|nr:hypothetical protein [Methanosarcinales archaeon]